MDGKTTRNEGMGLRFDKSVSLGHLLTMGLVLMGGVIGYTRLESLVVKNAENVAGMSVVISDDRRFQINQRENLRFRVNSIQEANQITKTDLASVSAKTDYIAAQVDLLVQNLIGRVNLKGK
jgi:hypothetical protein